MTGEALVTNRLVLGIEESLGHSSRWNGKNPSKEVILLDSTMREGEQGHGIFFTTRQKLQLAWMLDYFGIDNIEISPIVSRDHEECCKTMIRAGLKANIVAHVRALPSDIDVALRCGATWIAVYHSISDLHLKYKLRIGREEALGRAVKAVEYAKSHGLKLRFTMEDASRAEPDFLLEACKVVSSAGVDRISLPDTVGVMRPSGMYKMVKTVANSIRTPLDVHCHNDLGLAVANSLAGYEAGATQIHVTINGIGERVGIAPLAEISLELAVLYRTKQNLRFEMLKELSDLVEEYTGVNTPPSKPIVGDNAYRHKAGTHIAGIIRNPQAYEFLPPKLVGNRRKVIFGGLSGKNGAALLMKVIGLEPSPESAAILARGLKSLGRGDLFEMDLTEALEVEAVRVEEKISRAEKR